MKHKLKKGLGLLKKLLTSDTSRVRIFYYTSKRSIEVKDRTVLYESYHGKSMTGNPYAMYLYMINDKRFEDYTHIWILEDTTKTRELKNTKFIKRNSLKNAYHLLTSKYLINNTTFLPFVNKRKKQIYINTWHGTPLKTLGKDIKISYGNAINVTKNLLQTDYFISPNKYTTDIFLRSNDIDTLYPGKIIENGYPRNDLLFLDDTQKINLKKDLNIDNNKKTILYAPTFRGSHLDAESNDQIFIDFIISLNRRFADTYNILTKLHHIDHKSDIEIEHVPRNIDTNELLSIVDVLITDYSSTAFDFIPLKRPIIYYAFDLEAYSQDRGFYFDIQEMPGALCQTENLVMEQIKNIDTFMPNHVSEYMNTLKKFCKYEDGNVTEKIIETIFFNNPRDTNIFKIPKSNKKSILLYGGSFLNNGITSSLVGLLSNMSYDQFDIYLIANSKLNEMPLKRIMSRIPSEVKVIYVPESYTKLLFSLDKIINTNTFEQLFKKENYTFFGNANFDIAIDYSGYKRYWASMIAYSNASKKYIYLHSDMRAESRKRGHLFNFKSIYELYKNNYDGLITVSSSSHKANQIGLAELSTKIKVVHNPINAKQIINLSNEENPIEISDNKINFISIGRYSVEKGQDNLIKAFSKLCKSHDNLHLYLVGHGPLRTKLELLISNLNMNKHITLTGNMENPFPLLRKCNCFVLPSHYEGQGLVLLESLVLGIPCIATDIPGPRSILSGDQGLLVEDSIDGLKAGIEKFLLGKIPHKQFDQKAYTNSAMNEFYKNVC